LNWALIIFSTSSSDGLDRRYLGTFVRGWRWVFKSHDLTSRLADSDFEKTAQSQSLTSHPSATAHINYSAFLSLQNSILTSCSPHEEHWRALPKDELSPLLRET
jgi:hypothetical protein